MFEQYATFLWVALAWLTVHAVFLGVRLFFSKDRVSRLAAFCHGALSLGAFLAITKGALGILRDCDLASLFRTHHPYIAGLVAFVYICLVLALCVVLVVALAYHFITIAASWGARDDHVRSELF